MSPNGRERQDTLTGEASGSLFLNHPDAIFQIAPDGRIVDVNPAAARMVERDRDELVGRRIDVVATPERVEPDLEQFRAALEGRTRVFDSRGLRRDGTPFEVQIVAMPRLEDDRAVAVYAIVRDVDAERRARAELAASEARFRALYEHSMDAILLSDPVKGRMLACNPAAERLFGRSAGELKALKRDQVFDTSDPELAEFIRRRDAEGHARGVLTIYRADGSRVPVEATTALFTDEAGNTRSSVILRDISEQMRHERELRESEERYRALFEHGTDAILISRRDGRIFQANPAAQRLFGMSEEEICRLGREGLTRKGDPAVKKLVADRLDHGHARGELRMRRGDGSWFLAEVNTVGFRDLQGEDRTSVIIRDITRQREHEARLAASEERYRLLYEQSMDAILISETETRRLIAANPAAQALLGMSEEELCARPVEDVLDFDDPAVRRYYEERDRQGRARARLRIRCGDGSWFTAEVTSRVFEGARGQRLASTVMRDITEQEAYEARLRESEERFRIVTANTGQAVYELDLADASIVWAGAPESVFGLSSKAVVQADARERVRHIAPRDRERVVSAFREVYEIGGPYGLEYTMHLDDGRAIEVEDRGVVIPERNRVYGVIRDVTERNRLLRSLAEREQQLELMATAFARSEEAMLICGEDFVIREVNRAYERLMGLTREQAAGTTPAFLEIQHQADRVRRGLERRGFWHGELLHYAHDGRVFSSRASVTQMAGDNDDGRFVVVNLQDLSQLREYERRVDYLSYHDSLTGLPNRAALEQWFERYQERAGADEHLAMAYVDLDRFRAINETFGHSAGDALLKEIAQRLSTALDKGDYAVRLGGDDFIVILAGVKNKEDARQRVAAVQHVLSKSFEHQGRKLFATASAGVCCHPDDGRRLEELLRRADAAHAEAKSRGRATTYLYQAEMQSRVERRALIEQHLREAIRANELKLQFQPIVGLADGNIIGLEALARWDSAELGLVPPSSFIPVAEQTGLIVELGRGVLDGVCAQGRAWRDRGLAVGRIAVNLSPMQFQHPDLVGQIRDALARHRLEGDCLRIEITESVLMMDPERAVKIMNELRALGVETAMDDFGTGYSSMAYLKRFPMDIIKLDRTFIAGLPGNRADLSIVTSVVQLAKQFGMRVVAEGIENAEQRRCLLNLACDEAQGYYFSAPLDAEDIPWLLDKRVALPVA